MSFAWESLRVYRGGGWYGDPQFTRVANRSYITPSGRNFVLGLRLMRRCT